MVKVLKKKVLFLVSWYPSVENPTLGNFVQKHAELANEISSLDVLYAIDSETVNEITVVDELINGVRTVIVYYPPIKSEVPILSTVLKRETYLLALRTGYKYLDTRYDVVHLNAVFPAGMFAKWLKANYGIPYVVTVHWTGFLPHHKVYESLPFYVKRIYQQIFMNASKVLSVSDHLGKALQKLDLIKEYTVLNNIVKSQYFYSSNTHKSFDSPNRFLHISSFDNEHKNITGMLTVFGQLQSDFILHLVTEGDESEVWLLIKKYKIPKSKCIVESKLTIDKIGDAMRAADCLVLFSNYETFSVVLAEAWTSGLPSIYSQCGGLTEINDPELGVQIQSKEEDSLLNALSSFSRLNYDKDRICNFAHKFSYELIKNDFLTIY